MKPHNSKKKILTVLLCLACATTAHSQRTTVIEKAAAQRSDTTCQFMVASYHCFSSSFLTVTIRKECSEYVADWRKSYGNSTLQRPDSGSVILTLEQLKTLNEFADRVTPAKLHKENCSGTTYFTFASNGLQKEKRLCDCALDVWGELLLLIDIDKQGTVQHQL